MKNAFFFGDNLHVLREYVDSASVDLIYLDPPFNSNATYNLLYRSPDKTRWSDAQIATFEDTWSWGEATYAAFQEIVMRGGKVGEILSSFRLFLGESDMLAYLTMMAGRLVELRRVLKPRGSLYLHCDPTASHYLKILLDGVFGPEFFQNEIVWKRTGAHGGAKRWGPVHDTILFYSASREFTWNKQLQQYDASYIDDKFKRRDDRGLFQDVSLTGPGERAGSSGKPWRGVNPTSSGRHWAVPRVESLPDGTELPEDYAALSVQGKLDALDAAGLIFWPPRGKNPRLKRYASFAEGTPIQDVITDIAPLNSQSRERLGYPTQKPVSLLERIIASTTSEGDVVLDPFCGCGTTLHAAQSLGRRWIGIDVAVQAMRVVADRLTHAFPGLDYEVFGIPTSTSGAQWLAAHDPYKFEEWATTYVGGMHSGKFRGDGGIDGTFYFMTGKRDREKSRGIISVKGGRSLNPGMVRDLSGTLDRERRMTNDPKAIAVMICAHRPTRGMIEEALKVDPIQTDFGTYPSVQILAIEEVFAGKNIRVPAIYDVVTAAAAGRKRGSAPSFIDPREMARQRQMLFTHVGGRHSSTVSTTDGESLLPAKRKVG